MALSAPPKVSSDGDRHVEGEEQEQELCLPDHVLRDARDDVRQGDRETIPGKGDDGPSARRQRNDVLSVEADRLVVFELEVSATNAMVGMANPSSRISRKGISEPITPSTRSGRCPSWCVRIGVVTKPISHERTAAR